MAVVTKGLAAVDSHSTASPIETQAEADFPEVEKQFVRQKAYPDFNWVTFGKPSRINRLAKPISKARVALLSTCGAHLKSDPPFLKSPVGDASYREIPGSTGLDEILLSHIGYDTRLVSSDKNCVFPLDRLRELQAEGIVGEVAPWHFSFMGYVPVVGPLIRKTAPEVALKLKSDGVDLVILAPA